MYMLTGLWNTCPLPLLYALSLLLFLLLLLFPVDSFPFYLAFFSVCFFCSLSFFFSVSPSLRSMTLVGAQASSGSISPSNLVTTSLSYEWEVSGSWDSTRDLLAREPYFSAGEHFQEDQATLMVHTKHLSPPL